MPELVDLVGYSATVVGTSLMLPQVYKSFSTKRVADLSWGMLVLYCINCALWFTYGLLIAALPITLTNAAGLFIGVVLVVIKMLYSPPSREEQ